MLSAYFSFSQNQKDTIVFDRKLEEVTISATKTAKSIAKLPIPVMIISEKEIEEFGSSKLFDVGTKFKVGRYHSLKLNQDP